MNLIKRLLLAIAVSAILALVAGQFDLLQGRTPTDLGVHDGRLKPPARIPNSVSSQAGLYADHPMLESARIDPLPVKAGDVAGTATLAALKAIVERMPGARIVTSDGPYLYAQFTSQWFRFVDDTEFWFDPAAGVIQVRSASRLGESDLGVNRARIEDIRARLAATH
ncbi:MAG: DUF1499 domain-containing protein [Rhizobacter sp.]|jgi:uncharacterized protein (DUF1499 family)|nr:DUF1499 domain-containing protein [Rhizobacter sp.]MBP6269794.1 DUF1499 domain-containing protein [Rhizobacter sp.]